MPEGARRVALATVAACTVLGLGAALLPWISDLVGQDCTAAFYAEYYPDLWRKLALGAVGLVCAAAAVAAAWGGWMIATDRVTKRRTIAVAAGAACLVAAYVAAPADALAVDDAGSFSCYITGG